jgi:ABC-type antimicrobial peptide transport system permease subunit
MNNSARQLSRPNVMIDDTLAAKAWPGENPIGRRVWVRVTTQDMTSLEVVGVVRREAQDSLQDAPRETIYFPNGTAGAFGGTNDWVVRTTVDPLSIVPQVKQQLAALDARLPMAKVRPMRDYVADAMARTRFALQLIGTFGVAALAIAGIGLYAVIHYVVRQRRAEIGVRISFGAGSGDIFGLFLRYGMLLSATGLLIGVVAAAAVSRSISGLLVGVTAGDVPTYLVALLFFVIVALSATLLPAWRASRLEPMRVLREE